MALLRLSIEVLVDFSSLCCGVLPQKNPAAKISCVSLRFNAAQSLFYRLYWGCRRAHPYLLISLPGKRLHRDVGGFETGPSSNKPVQAKLRRLKSHFSPLLLLLLSTNPRRCKK
jgi:hypothetical protein